MSRKLYIYGMCFVAIAAMVAFWAISGSDSHAPATRKTEGRSVARRQSGVKVNRAKVQPQECEEVVVAVSNEKFTSADFVELALDENDIKDSSPSELDILRNLVVAIRHENNAEIVKFAREARVIRKPAVRKAVVTALGQIGRPVLAGISSYVADDNVAVVGEVVNQIETAIKEDNPLLSGDEDDRERAAYLELLMPMVTDDVQLDSLAMDYHHLNSSIAVESLLNLINGSDEQVSAKAKETYSFVTGDDYVNEETARAWIRENSGLQAESGSAEGGDTAL